MIGIQGEREQGQDVRNSNGNWFKIVTAILAIANIVKNTLGPAGLDKMMVDDIGDITITNDGNHITKVLQFLDSLTWSIPLLKLLYNSHSYRIRRSVTVLHLWS